MTVTVRHGQSRQCSLGELAGLLKRNRASPYPYRWVLCHGVFDVVHPGHLEHFKQAKAQGDRLIVAIVGDAHVRKGTGRPMFDEERRAGFLAALEIVDKVIVVDSPLAMPVLETLKPDVFCKGPDYTDPGHQFAAPFQQERAFVESYGGKVVLTRGFSSSSTAIIRQMKQPHPELAAIRQAYGLASVLDWMQRAKAADAIVIGEEIIDEYVYVRPLLKSSKDNIVSFEPVGRDTWEGGASIVEADLRQFASKVRRIKNGPPVRKLRYVDDTFRQKLFSLVEKSQITPPLRCVTGSTVQHLVVVADYGHGLIDEETARIIANELPSKCFAITVQSNSANWGFNLVTKWPRADYVVVDRNEMQLAWADRTSDISSLASRMLAKMQSHYVAVTLGHEGCLVADRHRTFRLPALTDKVVDRMGAGDAFLAATAPLAWAGAPLEVIALVGNVAGAIKVGKLGNQPVMQSEVETWLRNLLG